MHLRWVQAQAETKEAQASAEALPRFQPHAQFASGVLK